jgi:hypothetical protein
VVNLTDPIDALTARVEELERRLLDAFNQLVGIEQSLDDMAKDCVPVDGLREQVRTIAYKLADERGDSLSSWWDL